MCVKQYVQLKPFFYSYHNSVLKTVFAAFTKLIFSSSSQTCSTVRPALPHLQVEARTLRHERQSNHGGDAGQRTHHHKHSPAVELVGRAHAETPACNEGVKSFFWNSIQTYSFLFFAQLFWKATAAYWVSIISVWTAPKT